MAQQRTRLTALEMQRILQSKGHQVEIYFRKEGGARISKIDGVRFTGSKGNEEARKMLGVSLSKTQEKHLLSIKTNKGTFGHRKRKTEIPKDLINLQNRINREFKKQGKTARVTRSKIRYRISHYNVDEAKAYLERTLNYAKGYTYIENIEAFIARLRNDLSTMSARYASKLKTVIKALEKVVKDNGKLKEEYFQKILEAYYDWIEHHTIGLDIFVQLTLSYLEKVE